MRCNNTSCYKVEYIALSGFRSSALTPDTAALTPCSASSDEAFDIITEEEVSECVRYPLPDPKYVLLDLFNISDKGVGKIYSRLSFVSGFFTPVRPSVFRLHFIEIKPPLKYMNPECDSAAYWVRK